MKSKIKLTIGLVFISVLGISQQAPQFTQFWNNYSLYNPAYTASGMEIIQFGSNYRTDFDNSGNQPFIVSANYEHKIKSINSGVGLGCAFQRVGLMKSQNLYLNYAFHLPLPKLKGSLSIGVSADWQRMKFSTMWNGPTTGTNSSLDPSLPTGPVGHALNINSGVLFRSRKLKIGLSLTQINEPRLTKVNFTNARHLFALASYDFRIRNTVGYTPMVLFKSDFVSRTVELNNMFDYKKKVFLGASYRHTDAIAFQVGFQFKFFTRSRGVSEGGKDSGTLKSSPDLFKVMYSYDISTGPLSHHGYNSHEISIAYRIW